MKNEINIVHLTQRRKHFANLAHYFLSMCEFKNFDITLCGLKHVDDKETYVLQEQLSYLGLNTNVLIVDHDETHNYYAKIQEASRFDYKYTIKMDEDVFLGPQAWDYFFNNLNVLDDDNNVLLTPTLSTGIPTVDDFIKYNFNNEEKNHVENLFKKSNIPNLWGADYQCIRNYLIKEYNANDYYNVVKNVQHHYKGIHPVRVNKNVVNYMNNIILEKIPMFFDHRDFIIEKMTYPYLCNSFFAIKTKTYNEILNNKSLFKDAFDEVAINTYRNITGKNFLTIPNTFGIHVLYNTLHEMGMEILDMCNMEDEFFNFFSDKIKKHLKISNI